MAAQLGEVRSVPVASRLVWDRGAGNEHLFPQVSRFMAQLNKKRQAQSLRPASKIFFFFLFCRRE